MQRNGLGAVRVDEGPTCSVQPCSMPSAAWTPPDAADLSLPSNVRRCSTKCAGNRAPGERSARRCASHRGILRLALRVLPRALTQRRRAAQPQPVSARGPARTLRVLRHRDRAAAQVRRYSHALCNGIRRARVEPVGEPVPGAQRHAHAWALRLDGRWQELDTTPSVWAAEEQESASLLQPLYDRVAAQLSRHVMAAHRPRGSARPRSCCGWRQLAVYLAWRFWRRRRVRAPASARASPSKHNPAAIQTLRRYCSDCKLWATCAARRACSPGYVSCRCRSGNARAAATGHPQLLPDALRSGWRSENRSSSSVARSGRCSRARMAEHALRLAKVDALHLRYPFDKGVRGI
jgi:hypothetical protein